MKSLIALAAAAAVGAIAAPASAQDLNLQNLLGPVNYQASLGYTGLQTTGATLAGVNVRASAFFGKYLGVEGEGTFGVNDDTANFGAAAAQLHLNSEYAGYGVVRYPVLPNANLFARVGYGHSDLKTTFNGTSDSFGVDSVNYGAGGEYFVDAQNGVRVDYTRFDYRGNSGLKDADTWSVSYVHRF